MIRATRRTWTLTLIFGTAVLAGSPALMRERGWAPWVALVGGGDPKLTVERLEESLGTLGVLLGGGLKVDAPTREFIDGLRKSLGSFDLEGFHEMLPDSEGAWRKVRIVGTRKGDAYEVGRADPKTGAIDPHGPIGASFGDVLLEARTRPVQRPDRTNYVGMIDLGVGVGRIGWPQLLSGLSETSRLLGSGDPGSPHATREAERRAAKETRMRVLEAHPRLRGEDMEVVGLLWEAYPRTSAYLATIGSVEDVIAYDPNGKGEFQQLRLRMRLDPTRLEARFAELSEFLAEMGPLFKGELLFRDAQNRNLLRIQLDTEKLEVCVEGFVRDGRLLPVGHDGRVVLDPPPTPAGVPVTFNAVGHSTFNVNGIETRVRDMVLRSTYIEHAGGCDLLTEVTQPPTVAVSGSAYGFLPTWAIDVVIPGNMEELTREFLTTACQGDDGRGLRLALHSRQAGGKNGPATVQVCAQTEVLNSLLVRIAAQIANEKLLPSAEVREEIWTVFAEAHQAFLADFQEFAAQVR